MNDEKRQKAYDLLKRELSRRELWTFCMYIDPEFFSKRTFLKDIADGFQAIEDKEIKSLAVSMPPRSGKSYITSLFCAWTIGRNPERSVMRNTCTSTLYQKFSYDVRALKHNKNKGLEYPSGIVNNNPAIQSTIIFFIYSLYCQDLDDLRLCPMIRIRDNRHVLSPTRTTV